MDDRFGDALEFSAPLDLMTAFDDYVQRNWLSTAALVSQGESHLRNGVSADAFEEAWAAASQALSPYIAEATGASQPEVEGALRESQEDCSIAFITLLHQRGDEFQQACAAAAAVELQRRRRERSLEVIVREAAQQGSLPPELSSKKLLRLLRRHLPLSEIMGHRYRTESDPRNSQGVTFEDDDPSRRNRRSRSRVARDDTSRRRGRDATDSDSDSDDDKGSRGGSSHFGDSDWDDSDAFGEGGSSDEDDDLSDDSDSSESSRRSRSSRGSKNRSRHSSSNLMAVPPQNWDDGDPPTGGFYLETFTKIYQQYVSFKALHKRTGLTFKSLIQAGLEPTVFMECDIANSKAYRNMSETELLRRIKACLGFNDEDYFVRQLELLQLPRCNQSTASELYRAFRKLTTPFLRILREAKDSGVHLRKANVAQIFKNQIRGFPALERWFRSRKFKSFNSAIRHISQQLHDRIAKDIEEHHDGLVSSGRVAGARHALQGGKVESGQAQSRDSQDNKKRSGSFQQPSSKRPKHTDRSAQNKYPQRSQQDEAAFQAALQKEKELPRGMYFHPRGSFCIGNPCKAKICQGCNYHADAAGRGHIRPNCRCKDHPDFVATGYFHEKHPGRKTALTLPSAARDGAANSPQIPPPPPRARNPAGRAANVRGTATSGDMEQ
jgi:hypothetical protein